MAAYEGTIDEAWEGYSISMAMRHAPIPTRHAMINLVKHVSDMVDAAKRLETLQDYDLCVDYLLKSKFGGNYTLLDFRLICEQLIKAKSYNRLKVAEFVAAWEKYDEAKTDYARERNANYARYAEADRTNRVAAVMNAVSDPERPAPKPARPNRVDWMNGESNLTWPERVALQQRDMERRQAQQRNDEQV